MPLCCPSNTEQILSLLPENSLLSLLEPSAQEFSHCSLSSFGAPGALSHESSSRFHRLCSNAGWAWDPGSNHWNVGQDGETSVLVWGDEEGTGACQSHPGSQGALSPRGAESGGAEGAGFGDQDPAWHSPTPAEPLCPQGSPQTCHCSRGRVRGPLQSQSTVDVAAPRALHPPPTPAAALCPGGRQQSDINVPDSVTLSGSLQRPCPAHPAPQ